MALRKFTDLDGSLITKNLPLKEDLSVHVCYRSVLSRMVKIAKGIKGRCFITHSKCQFKISFKDIACRIYDVAPPQQKKQT